MKQTNTHTANKTNLVHFLPATLQVLFLQKWQPKIPQPTNHFYTRVYSRELFVIPC